MNEKKLKILFVSAEVSPFAKTGGLADVAGSLPIALAAMGNDIRVAMPRYKAIKCKLDYAVDFPIQMDNFTETCIIRESRLESLDSGIGRKTPVYFIDSYRYYDRDGIYCHFDDAERFIFFCKAVLEMLPKINFQPDIIHCNDWHTGPVCLFLEEQFRKQTFYRDISTIFTIHNLEYQGNFSSDAIRFLNLERNVFIPEKAEFYGAFSFMKTGLIYADVISTVSEMYAREIQTPRYGERLEGLLSRRSHDLFGIVNAIDYSEFNPLTDSTIARNYNEDSFDYKRENKSALQKEMGLRQGNLPVIGLVTRLSGQKGLDLILEQIDRIMSHELQIILLGMGDDYYETAFRSIERRYPEKMAVYIGFNATLAKRIYAGSDMFLMPSRFEPCGLGQIISMRYGTVPIVRATGGLAETVTDYDADRTCGNGFSFSEFSSGEMVKTIERALALYSEKPDEWRTLALRGLKKDNSWSRSAEKYMDTYYLAMGKRKVWQEVV